MKSFENSKTYDRTNQNLLKYLQMRDYCPEYFKIKKRITPYHKGTEKLFQGFVNSVQLSKGI